jgi:hypothetical protein
MAALAVAGQISPYITSALTAYGTAVLTRETVPRAPENAVNAPQDEDFQGALRAQIKTILRNDPGLVAELAALLPASADTFTASGKGSVAVKNNSGVISTGDGATIRR